MVGGAAAILYANHRESRDRDHVVADLADRFAMVLEAIEEDEGWATNRVTPGKVILGNLDGIEAGVRQMIRKEPLEAFPLEQLKMVGTLSQGKDVYALVRAEKTLYRVKKGNYMGQNFGLITEVTENEIKLKEIVQDSAGDWAERQSVLPLLEEPAGKGDKK